mmetsp:Transcript_12922/g.30781  ORF Transcript_12922/g.30781 Transcript_12922/m.30781 type:complete len:252 (+) Transcript_12922:386-1141(+)
MPSARHEGPVVNASLHARLRDARHELRPRRRLLQQLQQPRVLRLAPEEVLRRLGGRRAKLRGEAADVREDRAHERRVAAQPEDVGAASCGGGEEDDGGAAVAGAQHVQVELRHVPRRHATRGAVVPQLEASPFPLREGRVVLHLERLDAAVGPDEHRVGRGADGWEGGGERTGGGRRGGVQRRRLERQHATFLHARAAEVVERCEQRCGLLRAPPHEPRLDNRGRRRRKGEEGGREGRWADVCAYVRAAPR